MAFTLRQCKAPLVRVGREYDGAKLRDSLEEVVERLFDSVSIATAAAGSGGGSGGSSSSAGASQVFTWEANGPYTVDTAVDGARVSLAAGTVDAVWLYRTTPGTAGSTILDVNKNGSTIYTTTANRPTITFNDADLRVICSLPDTISVGFGDILTVDTDQLESGNPENWMLELRIANA